MAGANIWDLSAVISADTRRFDTSIKSTQTAIQQTRDRLRELAREANTPFKAAQVDALKSRLEKLTQQYKDLNKAQKESAKSQKEAASAMKDDLGGALQAISPRFAAFAASGGPIALGAAAFVAMAAAGVILSKQLLDLTLSTADWQGKLFDMSQQVGVSVEMLSGLEVAAATTGGNIDTMVQSLIVFQGKMEEANDSTSKAAKLFTELGISSTDTNQALSEAVAGLARMGEGYKQTNAAAEIFGRRGAKAFLAIAKETGGDLDKLNDKLRRMGILLSGEASQAADEFNDQLTILQYQMRGVGAVIGMEMMPPILNAFKDLGRLLEENQAGIKLLGNAARVLIAQPLQAWLTGNFYWLNKLGDALNYVTSRTWSVKWEFVFLGGVPIPLPGGLVGTTEPGKVERSGIGTFGRPADSSLGKGGSGGGGGKGGGAGKDMLEPYKRILADLQMQMRFFGENTEKARVEQQFLSAGIEKLTPKLKAQAEAIRSSALALADAKDKAKAYTDAHEKFDDLMGEWLNRITASKAGWDNYQIAIEKVMASLKGLTPFQQLAIRMDLEAVAAKQRAIDAYEKEADAIKKLTRAWSVYSSTRPRRVGVAENEDVYVDEAGRIIDRRPKAVTAEQDADRTRPRRALPDPWMEQYEKMRSLAESLTDLISSSLETGFRKGMKAGLAEFALGILQMIQAKILTKLTDAITDALMKGFGNAQAGAGGGGLAGSILGTIISGIFGGIGGGGGGSLPRFPAPGGKIPLPLPTPSFASGIDFVPHDMLAMIHKGEKIVPASQNNGGAVIINAPITVYARDAQSFGGRDTQTQITRQMQAVMKQAAVRVN